MGGGREGGGGEVLQLPCSAYCVVFFIGGQVSLIMSSFIQDMNG